MTIKKSLIAQTAISAVLIIVLVYFAHSTVYQNLIPSMNTMDEHTSVINVAGKQRMLTQKMSKELELAYTGNLDQLTAALATQAAFDQTLQELLGKKNTELNMAPPSEEINRALQQVDQLWSNFSAQVDVFADATRRLHQAGGMDETIKAEQKLALQYIRDNNMPLLKVMNAAVGKWAEFSHAEIKHLIDFSKANFGKQLMIGIISLVLTVVVSWFINRKISKPLKNMIGQINKFAQGDMRERIVNEQNDELKLVSDAVNTMADSLVNTIRGLKEETNRVRGVIDVLQETSNQVSASTQSIESQGQNVAAAGEELSVNVTSMSDAADQISTSAKTVYESVNSMRDSIEGVVRQVMEEVEIANQANVKTKRTSEDINALGRSAVEIEGVLDLIRNIAGQTNLLALNASIEAASAGEAGKGFAVVANEVKELAQQTTQATQDIEKNISEIRNKIESSVLSISEVTKVVEEVSTISQGIARDIGEQSKRTQDISARMNDVSDSTNTLARNVEESAIGANEVSKNMQGIMDSAASNSHNARSTDEKSRELMQTTEKLNQMINQFQLN